MFELNFVELKGDAKQLNLVRLATKVVSVFVYLMPELSNYVGMKRHDKKVKFSNAKLLYFCGTACSVSIIQKYKVQTIGLRNNFGTRKENFIVLRIKVRQNASFCFLCLTLELCATSHGLILRFTLIDNESSSLVDTDGLLRRTVLYILMSYEISKFASVE